MVIVRKSFFEAKVKHIVQGIIARKHDEEDGAPKVRTTPLSYTKRIVSYFFASHRPTPELNREHSRGPSEGERLRPDMIRRVATQPPQLLDPNGKISLKGPDGQLGGAFASHASMLEGDVTPGQTIPAPESEAMPHGPFVDSFETPRRPVKSDSPGDRYVGTPRDRPGSPTYGTLAWLSPWIISLRQPRSR